MARLPDLSYGRWHERAGGNRARDREPVDGAALWPGSEGTTKLPARAAEEGTRLRLRPESAISQLRGTLAYPFRHGGHTCRSAVPAGRGLQGESAAGPG